MSSLAVIGWRGMNEKDHGRIFEEAMGAYVAAHGSPSRIVSGGAKGKPLFSKRVLLCFPLGTFYESFCYPKALLSP